MEQKGPANLLERKKYNCHYLQDNVIIYPKIHKTGRYGKLTAHRIIIYIHLEIMFL